MSFRALSIAAITLSALATACGTLTPPPPNVDAAPAVAKVPVELLVRGLELREGSARVDMILKNTGTAAVPRVVIEAAAWGETATFFLRGTPSIHNLEVALPPGSARSASVDLVVPDNLPAPLSFFALRARPADGDAEIEDSTLEQFRRRDTLDRQRLRSYASLPGIGIASVHDRVFTRLITNHRSQAPTGFVLRLRGTITNLYSEEVHGVRYRVKFLAQESDSARVLGVDKIERHALKIPPGENKALSIELESSYVGVRGFRFVLETWPMKLGGVAIDPPDDW